MNFWAELIDRWAQQRPASIAFEDSKTNITYSRLKDFVHQLAQTMGDLELGPCDRIVVSLPRGNASASVMSALLAAELPCLPFERAQIASTFPAVAAWLDPSAVICLNTDLEMFRSKFPSTETVDVESALFPRESISVLSRKGNARKPTPKNAAWFLQTSGSTKSPRIVTIAASNLVERAKGEVRDFRLTKDDRIINALSFSHDVGLNQFLSTLVAGCKLEIHNQPFATALLSKLKTSTATGISGTPLLWRQLFAITELTFPNFRYVTVSGGSLPTAQIRHLQAMFPKAEVLRTYGQTETFRSLMNRSTDSPSLGRPIAGVELEIRDSAGSKCATDQIGELVHIGSGEMLQYFDDPVSTDAKLARPGIRTGDLFARDVDGNFHFHGRHDDMVKRFDSRVHLAEIEETINAIVGVRAAAVLAKAADEGDPRENLIIVFIELEGETKLTSNEVLNRCKSQLATFKHPDEIRVLPELPKTMSFKIDRQKLLAEWKST